MQHRISAGALVEHDGRILLVRHHRPGRYDFWVAPGGGAIGDEDLRMTAQREVREECGLAVELGALAYIEELIQHGTRHCKLWFVGRLLGGTLDVSAHEAQREYIVEAAFIAPADFGTCIVFPPMLGTHYAADKAAGFATPRYMGVRHMEFY
jgi:ADP-ribose pyrophosphatase YjhB (NUDIX family)